MSYVSPVGVLTNHLASVAQRHPRLRIAITMIFHYMTMQAQHSSGSRHCGPCQSKVLQGGRSIGGRGLVDNVITLPSC